MKYLNSTMLKSALKKSCTVDIVNERKVTFCKTVQIYGNSIKPEHVPDKYIEKSSNSAIDIELFSIETMIQAMRTDSYDCNLNEDPGDFFVHKVVYDDDDQLNDSCEDLKESVIENQEFSPNNSDIENEEFVVHQVTLQEDDASDESETENSTQVENKDGIVCELSVQNIEQHNKLTETQLHLECEIVEPLTRGTLNDSDIILSPPLQELGVNRLICPESDKWFWNLDISPLNSVQESDSESNVSSEDTMIMMTSEESAKNEQKIQESLQKFEFLKKQNSKTCETKPDLISEHILLPNNCNSSNSVKRSLDETSLTEIDQFTCNLICNKNPTEILSPENLSSPISNSNTVHESEILNPAPTIEKSSADCLSPHLVTIQIPKDVREWKIPIDKGQTKEEIGSSGTTDKEIELSNLSHNASFTEIPSVHQTEESLNTENYVDELEHFVDQCTERVERIRKRYSINENMLWTPRRGIKPRFGSSTAILQHFHNGNRPMLPAVNVNNNHYSWPYYITDDQQEKHKLMKPHSTGVLTNFLDNFQCEDTEESVSSETISVGGLQQFFKDSDRNSINWSLVNERVSTLSSFQEINPSKSTNMARFLPECDPEINEISDNTESIVYYSMHV